MILGGGGMSRLLHLLWKDELTTKRENVREKNLETERKEILNRRARLSWLCVEEA